jgi:predicted ATP-grasp superfamily ATP-dependent carboligase
MSRIKINHNCLIIVYEEPNIKLLVIQQRGNIVSGKRQEFVDQLLAFFKNEQLKEIIVLTAFNAVERNDVQLIG